jgi:hypothetical protein
MISTGGIPWASAICVGGWRATHRIDTSIVHEAECVAPSVEPRREWVGPGWSIHTRHA